MKKVFHSPLFTANLTLFYDQASTRVVTMTSESMSCSDLVTFLAIGMSMTSYLYSTCPKFMTDEKRDLSKASYSQAHCFMLCPECATVKGTRKAYGTWAYGMGWVGTGFAITTLVLLCLGACCCSGKKEENAGEKEEIVPKNE